LPLDAAHPTIEHVTLTAKGLTMDDVVYRIVEHDGGWAYKLGDVFSETFPTRAAAAAAAERVAAEQRIPGEDEAISWQDEAGRWHDEVERGSNRPPASVAHEQQPDPRGPRSPGQMFAGAVSGGPIQGSRTSQQGLAFARTQTRAQPLAAVLLAGLCGYGIAMLLHGRR
jgi:hypothetical protein